MNLCLSQVDFVKVKKKRVILRSFSGKTFSKKVFDRKKFSEGRKEVIKVHFERKYGFFSQLEKSIISTPYRASYSTILLDSATNVCQADTIISA